MAQEWTRRKTATASAEPRQRWPRWWWVAPLFAAAAGAGVWIAMRSPSPPPVPARPVVAAPVAPEPAPSAPAPAAPTAPSAATDDPSVRAPARAPSRRTPDLSRGRLLDPWHK